MADTKVSALTVASSVADADILPIVQSATSKSSAFSVVWTYMKGKIDKLFSSSPTTLSIASNLVATDAALSSFFDLTLTTNVTLSNPTNPTDCRVIKWRIRQDATGGWTVALGTAFRIPSSSTNPLPFSTAASKLDILTAIYDSADSKWDVVAFIPGY